MMNLKKSILIILPLLIVFTFGYCCLGYFTPISPRLTIAESNDAFLFFISLNLLFAISIILFTQYISISLVNKAAREWGQTQCKYCCYEKSKLVCSQCDSIQWDSSEGKIFSSIAIFLAHHRWKVINTILTLFLVGPLLFSMKFHFEEVDKIEGKKQEINKEIQRIINYTNNIRPRLYNLKLNIETESIRNDYLTKEREYLVKNYHEYAWELAKIVDYLKHDKLAGNKHLAHDRAIVLFNKNNLIIHLDSNYFDVINSIEKFLTDRSEKENLKSHIDSFNLFTKAIACAIGEVSFTPEINHDEEEIIDGCLKTIENINEKLDSIQLNQWRTYINTRIRIGFSEQVSEESRPHSVK